jgi:acyl carrier protein
MLAPASMISRSSGRTVHTALKKICQNVADRKCTIVLIFDTKGLAMTREEFLAELDELVELPPGTLKGPESLESLDQWTSMAIVGFLALADTYNGTKLGPTQIAKCSTVDDLLKLARVDQAS